MSRNGIELTNSQRLIWLGQSMMPETPLYNMAWRFDLRLELSPTHFKQAFQALVDRNDALRLAFESVDGGVQQRVRVPFAVDLPVIDLSREANPAHQAAEWMAEAATRIQDLSQQAFESVLLKLAHNHWVWYVSLHHLITDAWSVALLYGRLADLYRLTRECQPDQYLEYLSYLKYVNHEHRWRDTAEFAQAERHWAERASATPSVVSFYGVESSSKETTNTRIDLPFGKRRSERLNTLGEREEFRSLSTHLTRFNLLATAVFAFLKRVSGQDSVTIGTPMHNRASLALRETVGLFIEMFPLRVKIGQEDSFLSLFKRVSAESQSCLRNAQPGASTAALSRQYNVVLNHIHASFKDFDGQPVAPQWLHSGHVDPGHDLRIQIHDLAGQGRYLAQFDCSDAVFTPALREAATRHFLRLLDAMIEDPGQRISHVALCDEADRQHLLTVFNGAADSVTPAESVLQRFHAQAVSNPDAAAVRCGDTELSYAELARRSDPVAANLASRGVNAGVPVGVFMNRSVEFLVAVLAILKSGGGFVPLEASLPIRRLAYIVEDAGIELIMTQSGQSGPPGDIDAEWVPMDRALVAEAAPLPPDGVPADPDRMAYVIYTSGSTGFPKGVVVQHGPLAAYIDWAYQTFAQGRRSDFPLYSAIGFDLTITSLFVPLVSGGCVVVHPEDGTSSDLAVLKVFEEDAVDVVKLTPAHLALILERPRPPSRIRSLILGGENLRVDLARRAQAELGNIVIFNEYGPTEGVVGCMVHRFDPTADSGVTVPIGVPAAHHRIYVLDPGGNPPPMGVAGELCIAGDNLARGYLNRDDLTAERFVRDPFHPGERMYRTGDLARFNPAGLLDCLGRIDEQIKLGSIRIEPAEIQRALLTFPGISDCTIDLHEIELSKQPERLQYCSHCGLSSAYPGITFDARGICHLCTGFGEYRHKAEVYFGDMGQLSALLDDAKRRSTGTYDCIALLSGGKDSTYALYRVAELGPRLLAITLDNGYISDGAKQNIRKVVDSLGIDHRFVSTPAMSAIFSDSLERHSNVCNGCFKTIYTLAIRIAIEESIPYIVTGLSRGQFFETRLTPDLFMGAGTSREAIERTVLEARKAYHHIDDAVSRLLDVSMFDDDQIFEKVRFIDFYRYCNVGLDEVYRFLDRHAPWIRPADTGRSTNCLINDAGIYVHKRKEGFHNYALPYSWDVRMGHKTREAALGELDDRIDVGKVQQILNEIGYHEEVLSHGSPGRRLIAYYVADRTLDDMALRKHMAQYLTGTMIPSHFVPVERIPLTGNGKVDRSALPAPTPGRPQPTDVYRAPVTPLQRTLAEIWRSVLGVARVGLSDNYYALGGDSISAIQIAARAREHGLTFAATDIFKHLTLASLAQRLEGQEAKKPQQTDTSAPINSDPDRFSMANLDADKLGKLEKLLGKG